MAPPPRHRRDVFLHRYDDGDTDKNLKAKHVKALDSGSESDGSAKKDKLREGDKVKARFRGLEKYYKGVIRRAHSDGTYSIDYDDGEKESHVKERYIKKRSSSRSRSRSRSRSPKRSKKPRSSRMNLSPVMMREKVLWHL